MSRLVFLIAHAEATHHVEGLVGGWYDSGLTDKGLRDSEAIAARLEALVAGSGVELYASDLRRARETAAAIGRGLGVPVTTSPALREISYGEAEGKPQAWLDARYRFAPDDNRLDHDVGIAGAETRREVAERVYPFATGIFARPAPVQVIVTHGFTLSLVIAAWMKLPVEAIGFVAFPVRPGSITTLREDEPFRNRALVALSDVSHLA